MVKRIVLLVLVFVLGWSPVVSATSLISFTAFNRHGNAEIYVMNPDGSNETNLTNNTDHDEYSAWSPDGTEIAFRSDRDGNREIYVMNSDGSNVRRLTNNAARDQDPSWSPDGLRIAFASNRDGKLRALRDELGRHESIEAHESFCTGWISLLVCR